MTHLAWTVFICSNLVGESDNWKENKTDGALLNAPHAVPPPPQIIAISNICCTGRQLATNAVSTSPHEQQREVLFSDIYDENKVALLSILLPPGHSLQNSLKNLELPTLKNSNCQQIVLFV